MQSVVRKKNPLRMCIFCRKRFFQKELMRLKVSKGDFIFFDGFGRSFYLCASCLDNQRLASKIQKVKQIAKTREQIQLKIEELRSQWQMIK